MRRNEEDLSVPIAPLIDITFLLIIFFVVTASLQKEVVDWQVILAKSQHVPPPDEIDPTTVIINVRHTGELTPPVYSIAGTVMTLDDIERMLLRAHARNGSNTPVVIRASRDAKWLYIDQLNKRIANAKLTRVRHTTEVSDGG